MADIRAAYKGRHEQSIRQRQQAAGKPRKGIWNDNGGDFMNESQINLELYHKMREEQDEYRSWLLSQPPRRS